MTRSGNVYTPSIIPVIAPRWCTRVSLHYPFPGVDFILDLTRIDNTFVEKPIIFDLLSIKFLTQKNINKE